MKKLAGSFLALAFICLCTVPIYAGSITGGSTMITAEVRPAYTVTIPEKLEIPYGSREAQPLRLTASGLLMGTDGAVSVTAVGSGVDGAFTMANGSGVLPYELSKTNTPWNPVAKSGEVASFTADDTATIYARVPDWSVTNAGIYKGTIIFTVSYE